jgi:hypothetical protein
VEAGQEYPNLVLIINMKDGTTSLQEIPTIAHIAWAAFDPGAGATTFASQTIPFDEMVGQFGQRTFAPGRKRLLMADPIGDRIILGEQGFTNEGDFYNAYVERTGLAVVGTDRFGQPKVDTTSTKVITEVWPRMRMLNGTTVHIQVGAQETIEGPVVWSNKMVFDSATMDKVDVDPPIDGRYMAIRFESIPDVNNIWKLDGYDLEMHLLGQY